MMRLTLHEQHFGNDMGRSRKATQVGEFRLGFLVHDVSRLRKRLFDKAFKPLGITRSQWWVLTNLSRQANESMVQTELAKVLDTTKGGVGQLLERLEAGGYIVRRADSIDRRAKRIDMTAKGRDLLKKIQIHGSRLNQESMQDFSASDVQMAEELMHRMKRRLIQMERGAMVRTGATDNGAQAVRPSRTDDEPIATRRTRRPGGITP